MSASPPNTDFHVPYEISATSGAPGASSAGVISRPIIGETPSVSSNVPLTYAAVTRTGCVLPPKLVPCTPHASSVAQEFVSFFKSKNSAAEVQNLGSPPFGKVGNSV